MLGNFFWRSADLKQRERNVEIDSAASSGGQGRCAKYVCFPWHPLKAAMSVCYVGLLLFVKTVFDYFGINKSKGDCH